MDDATKGVTHQPRTLEHIRDFIGRMLRDANETGGTCVGTFNDVILTVVPNDTLERVEDVYDNQYSQYRADELLADLDQALADDRYYEFFEIWRKNLFAMPDAARRIDIDGLKEVFTEHNIPPTGPDVEEPPVSDQDAWQRHMIGNWLYYTLRDGLRCMLSDDA